IFLNSTAADAITPVFVQATPFNIPVGTDPHGISVGDFNRDGRDDLAIVNSRSNNISILLGNGNGTFGPATNLSSFLISSPEAVAIADFNRDGKLDLAIADLGSNDVWIFLGDGAGGFTATA